MPDTSHEQDLADSYRDYHRDTERSWPVRRRRYLDREDYHERMLLAAGSAFVSHPDYDTLEERAMDLRGRGDE